MGNTSSNVSAPMRGNRRRSPRAARAYSPKSTFVRREKVQQSVESPIRNPQAVSKNRRRRRSSVLPRDPTTGRYLPRGCGRAASPQNRRKVAVEVITTPQSEVHAEAQFLSTTASRGKGRRAVIASEAVTSPRQRRSASPRIPAVRNEKPTIAAPRAKSPVAAREPTARGSPILRSSYTRARSVSPQSMEGPGVRAAAPAQPQAPVSRREYASPSLAADRRPQAEEPATIGPSTNRRVRKMAATTPVSEADFEAPEQPPTSMLSRPVEKLAHSAPKVENPTDLLFSYLNAA